MTLKCKSKHPLWHDGTSRQQRFLQALDPSFAKPDEFSLRDWMRFAYHFAAKLNFFNLSDDKKPDGNWQIFMKSESEIESFLKDAALVEDEDWIPKDEREKILKRQFAGNYEPHLALFLSFLKLMKFAGNQLNEIPKRHLDFYYQEVLQISKRPATPDRVHLIFNLAKNANSEILPSNALTYGSKDNNGKTIHYATTDELVVNKASVSLLKSIFHDRGKNVRYAEMTNSSDGLGTEFINEKAHWNAFGNESWPAATVGFALASDVLLLKEGERTITITLHFQEAISLKKLYTPQTIQSQLLVLLTGEEEWIQVSQLTVKELGGAEIKELSFEIKLTSADTAVVPYSADLHHERFNTNLPVVRVLINNITPEGYQLYDALNKAVISNAEISVSVDEMKDLVAENDQGKIDVAKPFYPFGTTPKKGSNFYIGSSEIFQKNWSSLKLNILWKNKPGNFQSHYASYSAAGVNVTGDAYFGVKATYLKDGKWFPDSNTAQATALFNTEGISLDATGSVSALSTKIPGVLLMKGININKAVLTNYLAPKTNKPKRATTFTASKAIISPQWNVALFNPGFKTLNIITGAFNAATKTDYLRLSLVNSFLHEHYVNLYTEAMIKKANKVEGVVIPNQPYTPEITQISISYEAKASNRFIFDKGFTPEEKLENYTSRTIQFFHEHPFGQNEQHVFLKEQASFIDSKQKREISLLPSYSPEGEFYIGLKDAFGGERINLLFQAVEGSEDPMAPVFTPEKEIQWEALVNNEWQSLNKDFISGNSTHNFLRPGIVKIQLPAAANNNNTLLEDNHHWIKIRLPQGIKHTSVCKFAGIHAQALEAVFENRGNELSHLLAPVPEETIEKIADKPPLIKGVFQPWATFGGAALEDENAFYLRISERLRHKNRAVNINDYERMVLQEFPSVYKAKCISHTSLHDSDGKNNYFELQPGHVTLVVIPDIRNQNSFDPLRPRASQNLLQEIAGFINQHKSMHVKFETTNPLYETVLLNFRVKFHKNFDPNAYKKILNQDIVRYLSPWAFGDFSSLNFGGTIHKSIIISFIEDLPYVDYISRFKLMLAENMSDVNLISASSARAILVSASEHSINFIDNDQICDE